MALARVKQDNTYGQHRSGELVEVDELEFEIVPHCLERVEAEATPIAYELEPVDDAPLHTAQDAAAEPAPPADEELEAAAPEPVNASPEEVKALRARRKAEAKARKAMKAAASASQDA